MLQLDENTIALTKGEPVPASCVSCRRTYSPPLNSECSTCPNCGVLNHHQHNAEWEIVEVAE